LSCEFGVGCRPRLAAAVLEKAAVFGDMRVTVDVGAGK
jgi:hypothetical protein